MTPEQLEGIKQRLTERQARRGWLSREEEELMAAMAALEEAEQQLKEVRHDAKEFADELAETLPKLAEAQQTIARIQANCKHENVRNTGDIMVLSDGYEVGIAVCKNCEKEVPERDEEGETQP